MSALKDSRLEHADRVVDFVEVEYRAGYFVTLIKLYPNSGLVTRKGTMGWK